MLVPHITPFCLVTSSISPAMTAQSSRVCWSGNLLMKSLTVCFVGLVFASAMSCFSVAQLFEIEFPINRVFVQLILLEKLPRRQIDLRRHVVIPMVMFGNFRQLDREAVILQKVSRGPDDIQRRKLIAVPDLNEHGDFAFRHWN